MSPNGKIVLVTGSTDGVGQLVARRLADQGARVLIHGRDRHRGKKVVDQIHAAGRGSAVFLSADLSSLAEVRRLADLVRHDCDRLNVLMNNAGIGSGGSAGKRETSLEGYELRFAVNYLAGFLLTRLLLPLLMVSKPARIVNVSSLAQQPIDFDDVMLTRGYTGGRAYAQSKLGQIMFTFDLARELDPKAITANCLHPATYMATTMVRQSGVTPVSSVEEGAEAILNLAMSKERSGPALLRSRRCDEVSDKRESTPGPRSRKDGRRLPASFNFTQAGAWSLAPASPRTSRSTPAAASRLAASALNSR